MKPVYIFTTLCLCALSAAAGYWFGIQPSATAATESKFGSAEQRRASAGLALPDKLIEAPSPNEPISSKESLKQRIDALSATDAPALLRSLLQWEADGEQRGLIIDYFRRLGEIDPDAAIAATTQFTGSDRMSYLTAAIAGWARHDPDAAWDRFLLESHDGMLDSMNPWAIMSEYAKRDISDAVKRAQQLKSPRARSGAMSGILHAAEANGDFSAAWVAVEGIDDPKTKTEATNRLFQVWHRKDADAALQAVQSIADATLRDTAMKGYISGWAAVDAVGALNFVVDNFSDASAADSAASVGFNLVRSLPSDELLDTISSISNPAAQEKVVSRILRDLIAIDPSVAMSFAEKISDPNRRASETRSLVRKWMEFDVDAAANYVTSIEDDRTKARVMSTFANESYLENDIQDGENGGSRYLAMAASIKNERERLSPVLNYARAIDRLEKGGRAELAEKMKAEIAKLTWLTDDHKALAQRFASGEPQ